MLGMPDYTEQEADGTVKVHAIIPFRLFNSKMLPKKVKSAFKVNWEPVFRIMDKAIPSGDSHPTVMRADELEDWWKAGSELLMTRASYCFAKPHHRTWGVATWSKKVQPSQIRKFGTATNIEAVPPPKNNWCRKERGSKGRKRPQKEVTLHRRRRRITPEEEDNATRPPGSTNNSYPDSRGIATPPIATQIHNSSAPIPPAADESTPLTEEEKARVMVAARKETLEESVNYMIRHMMARWKESGEPEPTPINEEEKLSLRHQRSTSSSLSSPH